MRETTGLMPERVGCAQRIISVPEVIAVPTKAQNKAMRASRAALHNDGSSEAEFIRVYAATGDALTAYKKAGYPVAYSNGKKMRDSVIAQRAQALLDNKRVQALIAQSKQEIISAVAAEWTRDEIISGYRKLYQAAVEHVVCDTFNKDGELTGTKYNDKAVGNAVSILERITKIYGYDAPQKVDATVNFVFDGIGNTPQAPTIDAAQSNAKTYDYTAEPEKVLENAAGEAVSDSDAEVCIDTKKFAV